MKSRRRPQTLPEEIANALCHGLAAVAFAAGYPLLLEAARHGGRPYAVAGVTVFAGCMVLLYSLSAIHHALPRNEWKRLFQRLDQTAIFLCIAATYTPFALLTLQTSRDWAAFDTIWGLTLGAIVFRAFQGFRGTHFTTFLYVGISVLALVALGPALRMLPAHGVLWLVAGLGCYLVGILFFLAHHLRFRHLAWHACAVAGTACHFLAVWWYAC